MLTVQDDHSAFLTSKKRHKARALQRNQQLARLIVPQRNKCIHSLHLGFSCMLRSLQPTSSPLCLLASLACRLANTGLHSLDFRDPCALPSQGALGGIVKLPPSPRCRRRFSSIPSHLARAADGNSTSHRSRLATPEAPAAAICGSLAGHDRTSHHWK